MGALFDQVELLERVDNDVGFLAETVQMLESDGRGLMEEVRAAVERGDAAAVGRAAHALKGMISNFCAAGTQERALAVEKLGKAANLDGAAAEVAALGEELEALIAELQAFVRERS